MTQTTFDVFGIEATAELGEIFQNTPWWWHPLWDYCLLFHEDIAGVADRSARHALAGSRAGIAIEP